MHANAYKCITVFLLMLTSATAQAPPREQQRAIVSAWNECVASIERENVLLEPLQKSLKFNPPWRVTDAQAPATRTELIDKIITEHKKRIELLEKIKREDSR